ncbi:MAG: YihY/virulence factor BrkB family protein [Thermoleophilia bacterium]|jgi:membrane protein
MRKIWTLILRTRADGCTGLASMLAYSFFLTLIGVLIMTVSVLAYLPVDNLGDIIIQQLTDILPTDALSLIDRTLSRTFDRGRLPILISSLLGTVYVMSNGYHGLISSLNRIYRLQETRPWVNVRLRALVMSLVAAIFIMASFAMVVVAPIVADALSDDKGISVTISMWLGWMRWPAIVLLALAGVGTTYRYGPCCSSRWRYLIPGTLFASGAWLLSTLVFGFYVEQFGTYESVYGTLGAVVVLLTWMWLSALMVLTGAEVNILLFGERLTKSWKLEQVRAGAPDI